jgi:pimeloyl-ACP methyl ester carboxylesterase
MTTGHLLVNGHSLYFEQRGPADGLPVILLHHGLGSTRAWRSQLVALAKAGYRLIAYDRWGYGRSDPRAELSMPYFRDDQDDLLALLDQLLIERVALVGHSDGGTIALYFAARFPHRVSCLAILAAHAYVEEKMTLGLPYVLQQYQEDADFRLRLQRRHGDKTEAVVMGWYHGWHKNSNLSWDMRPELNQIRCPVLVMQGEADEHATPQHAIEIAQAIPGAELVLLPETHHMLQREQAGEVNRRLLQFFRQAVRQEIADVQ